jgi:hypothetical protein
MGLQEDWDSASPDLSSEWDQATPDQTETALSTPEPSMGDVAMNAIPKGVANFLHTPNMITSLVLKGLHSIPGMENVPGLKELGDRFERNGIAELMTKGGLIDPAKNPQTGPQRVVDMAIQAAVGSAAVPGGGLVNTAKQAALGATSGAAAQSTKEFTGSDLLASVVGMAAPVMTKLGADALARGGKKLLLNDTAKMTLKEAQVHGYVVEPSQVRQPTSKLETVAGKAAIAQEASIRNQMVTNKLAARSLGLPEDTPLSMSIIEEVRERAATPYKEISQLIPGGQLQGLKVSTVRKQDMVPGPATGLKVTRQEGPPPTTGVAVREVRDDAGNLIGMKTVKQSEGTTGALEGLKAKVTSRGQDVPGPLQGLRVNVQEQRGIIPLEELKQETMPMLFIDTMTVLPIHLH